MTSGMDARRVARLFQGPQKGVAVRFGRVATVGKELGVVIDGDTEATPVQNWCNATEGDRVLVLRSTTQLFAIAKR